MIQRLKSLAMKMKTTRMLRQIVNVVIRINKTDIGILRKIILEKFQLNVVLSRNIAIGTITVIRRKTFLEHKYGYVEACY